MRTINSIGTVKSQKNPSDLIRTCGDRECAINKHGVIAFGDAISRTTVSVLGQFQRLFDRGMVCSFAEPLVVRSSDNHSILVHKHG